MQFMLLCCIDSCRWDALSSDVRDDVMRDYGKWIEATVRSGRHVLSNKLADPSEAKTVRMQAGKSLVTDGPFAETKEQLGGFHILECRDLEEALELVHAMPTLRVGGTVEVRAVEPSERQPFPASQS
jgi:hypothetical protein